MAMHDTERPTHARPNRYILGRQILAAGDDRKAEILFLEALDAEPITFGSCAALLSALQQVFLCLWRRCCCSACLWRNMEDVVSWQERVVAAIYCTSPKEPCVGL